MKKALPAIGLTLMGTAMVLRFQTASPEIASADASAVGSTTSTASSEQTSSDPTSAQTSDTATSAASGTAATASTTPTTSTTSGLTDGTYTGDSESTRYGPVEVQITVSNGQIVDAQAVSYPSSDGHSQSINSQAIPTYTSEVLTAQSADIDAMSGATVTWGAFVASVASAITQAQA